MSVKNMNFSLDALLLNINAIDFSTLVSQTEIQTVEDKERYSKQGYIIRLTENEFKDKFDLDPSHIWYTPSLSCSSLYFNKDTFAVAPFHIDLFLSGLYPKTEVFYRGIEERESEVANNDFSGSVSTLPDGMRMEYFKLLVEKKGDEIPDLYELFFSSYLHSDYGFGSIDPDTLDAILNVKTETDRALTEEKLENLPERLKVYRGGNTASTPAEEAYSWSLDINVANFFACRHGSGEGYIAEAEVAKKDIIDVFLDNRDESEIIAKPEDIMILHKIPVHGLEFIGPILPVIAPMYRKYKEQLEQVEFAQDSDAHGYEHEARVLLHCLTISHLLGLPARDQKALALAAIYHDTGRVNDITDPTHGKASKEYYHNHVESPDPVVEFLIEYHCLPDEEGYQEIRNNRKLSKNRSKTKLLYDILKDADALDRVRFGLKDLDINQLRIPVSKELSLVARLYLEQVNLSIEKNKRKPSLSSQIQSAANQAAKADHDPEKSKIQSRGESERHVYLL